MSWTKWLSHGLMNLPFLLAFSINLYIFLFPVSPLSLDSVWAAFYPRNFYLPLSVVSNLILMPFPFLLLSSSLISQNKQLIWTITIIWTIIWQIVIISSTLGHPISSTKIRKRWTWYLVESIIRIYQMTLWWYFQWTVVQLLINFIHR